VLCIAPSIRTSLDGTATKGQVAWLVLSELNKKASKPMEEGGLSQKLREGEEIEAR
jgi:hypothetical protein